MEWGYQKSERVFWLWDIRNSFGVIIRPLIENALPSRECVLHRETVSESSVFPRWVALDPQFGDWQNLRIFTYIVVYIYKSIGLNIYIYVKQ